MTTFFTKRSFLFLFFIFNFSFVSLFAGGSNSDSKNDQQIKDSSDYKTDNYYRYVNLVSKGWNLLIKWDFYNNPENWNISSATRQSTGGYFQVEDGVMQFGYSTLGAIIYSNNNISIIAGYSYLLLSRIKASNPYRAFLGFYKPPQKKLHYYSYVKNTEWDIVSCLYTFATYSGFPVIESLFPAIQVLTKQDNVYVDWIELWALPEVSK